MSEEEYPEFSEELVEHIDEPFDGLFGNNVQTRVVEELTADPFNIFRPKELEELTDSSTPSIRRALKNLVELDLVEKKEEDSQHPVYRVNMDSKVLKALTFLSLALIDDKEETNHLDQAVIEYCKKEDLFPIVQASSDTYEVKDGSTISFIGKSESAVISDEIVGGGV
ncbi:MAG: hypothetical protein ACLFVB_09845 [Thermoplasmata archaeon]